MKKTIVSTKRLMILAVMMHRPAAHHHAPAVHHHAPAPAPHHGRHGVAHNERHGADRHIAMNNRGGKHGHFK